MYAMKVYAPNYFIERGGGKYSVNLSLTTLSAFETYYDLPYPLRKLDNVALPQFYFNAMVNEQTFLA
jgi:aminopeptidase N